jgi:hypothetical protein
MSDIRVVKYNILLMTIDGLYTLSSWKLYIVTRYMVLGFLMSMVVFFHVYDAMG